MLGLINQHNRPLLSKGATNGNLINPHGRRHRGSTDRITKGVTMKQLLALVLTKDAKEMEEIH